MYTKQTDLMEMIASLTEEYRISVVNYVEYLAHLQKTKAKTTLHQIQEMFIEDKGWASEDEMLADMANFRRERLAKCEY